MLSSVWGALPGILETAQTTYENAFAWGGDSRIRGIIKGELIAAAAVDAGASPTYRLRPGLLLGKITSSGKLREYLPANVDGSQVAYGVLITGLRMQDVVSGSTVDKFYGVLVAGPVQAAKLYGLDQVARSQMHPRFLFDDDVVGVRVEWENYVTKTAAYTVVAADSGTLFNNVGAAAAVTFTLPALALNNNALKFGFRVEADQSVTIASAAGDDMVVPNDAAADSVAFSTAGDKIGGFVVVYTNSVVTPTKWIVEKRCSNAMTIAT